jgi:hypothetical protein
MDDFTMLLPMGILDESGLFLEEPLSEWPDAGQISNGTLRGPQSESGGATPLSTTTTERKFGDDDDDDDLSDDEDDSGMEDGGKKKRAKKKGGKVKKEGSPNDTLGGGGEESEADKVKKRRQQIAAASRASRARRKRELEDLRDENKRLREERSQFLSKIGELQMKVEHMRERGSTDMRVENELLRAQLEEHKRFVSCFKRLCEGAPTSLNARHMIYKQGSDSAQAHVLGLISQSQADDWIEAIVPPEADIPYQNFSMFYKFKNEYGEGQSATGAATGATDAIGATGAAPAGSPSATGSNGGKGPRQRLNVRVDVLFPGMDAVQIAEFFWNSFSNTSMQSRLYKVKGIELTQLADDMPDKDTKTVYYREKWEAPKKDQDWVIICNRRRRELASSTLALPQKGNRVKPEVGKVAAMVLALATTQHSVAPQFDNANRITSLFVQGAVTWNVGSDARLCAVFSLPDDLSIKAVEKFDDVIDSKGRLTQKFAAVLRSFREMMGESTGHDLM